MSVAVVNAPTKAVSTLPKPRSLLRLRPTASRVTQEDIHAIAQLVASRFSEVEACAAIGLKIETWKSFKTRHAESIAHVFSVAKTNALIGHVRNIERFESKDWRASRELLALKDPSRFGKSGEQALPQTLAAIDGALSQALLKAYGQPSTQVIVDTPPSQSIVDVQPLAIENKNPTG